MWNSAQCLGFLICIAVGSSPDGVTKFFCGSTVLLSRSHSGQRLVLGARRQVDPPGSPSLALPGLASKFC